MKILTTLFYFVTINLIGQTSDTLIVNFQTKSFSLDKSSINKIKSFVEARNANTVFKVFGHADDVGTLTVNKILSNQREIQVYQVLIIAGIDASAIQHEHFGELKPIKSNDNDANRAINRRVELIKYETDPINEFVNTPFNNVNIAVSKPITKRIENELAQSNGIRIKYGSNNLSKEVEDAINNGGNPFQMIENTTQMQANDILTTTTNGQALSSLVMVCPPRMEPCNLDTPITLSIPIHNPFNCPLDKIKFFYSAFEEGKKLWKESNNKMYPEIIDGKQYINITILNTCDCINLDYIIEMPCFHMDTVYVKFPKAEYKYFETITNSNNSVLRPKLINDKTIEIIIPKNKPGEVLLDAAFKIKSKDYKLKHVPLTEIPYSLKKKYYYLTKKKIKNYK